MLKRITYAIVQLWYQITAPVVAWMEWQDAKHWAKEYRPAWVQFATKCKCKELRWYYRIKIVVAYREVLL